MKCVNSLVLKKDIPAPDMGTTSRTMSWIMDAYSAGENEMTPGIVTGKPPVISGSLGRDSAPGRSVALITKEACKYYDKDINNITVAVQGYGSVGGNAARLLDEWGATIVALSDENGVVYNKNGLDTLDIPIHTEEPEGIKNYDGATIEEDKNILYSDVDILIPAAIGNVITEENANKINADIIVEGSNGPTNLNAEPILRNNDTVVIPDILANAGGVVVSYYEWVQGIGRRNWTLEHVQSELEKYMLIAWEKVKNKYSNNPDITWRDASYMVAIERLNEAYKERGHWP